MFLTESDLTETVLPRELGLGHQGPVPPGGVARVIGGRTVRYTRPYGTHPAIREVVLACAREALPSLNAPAAARLDTALLDTVLLDTALLDTVLVLLAEDSTQAREVLEEHAAALRVGGVFAGVHTFYLADPAAPWPASPDTRLPAFAAARGTGRVVVVPFANVALRASGDGLSQTEVAPEPQVYYALPVGQHPGVAGVVRQVAQEARGEAAGGDLDQTRQESWALLTRLAHHGGLRLGEVLITPDAGLFDLRNVLDEGRPTPELVTYATPEGLRGRIRLDDGGRYRPVRTLRTLPRGWRAVVDERDLPAAVHALYPAVVEESRAYTLHNLRYTPWPTTARRQTGRYARVQKATPAQVEAVAAQVCSGCLRRRLWAGEALALTFLDGMPGGIPCAEACTYFVGRVSQWMGDDENLGSEQSRLALRRDLHSGTDV